MKLVVILCFFLDDYVGVYIDTYLDLRNCYGFEPNSLGTQADKVQNEGANSGSGSDMAWDCNWNGQSIREKINGQLNSLFHSLNSDSQKKKSLGGLTSGGKIVRAEKNCHGLILGK